MVVPGIVLCREPLFWGRFWSSHANECVGNMGDPDERPGGQERKTTSDRIVSKVYPELGQT